MCRQNTGTHLNEDVAGLAGGVAAALAQLGQGRHVIEAGVAEDEHGGGVDGEASEGGGAASGGSLHAHQPCSLPAIWSQTPCMDRHADGV